MSQTDAEFTTSIEKLSSLFSKLANSNKSISVDLDKLKNEKSDDSTRKAKLLIDHLNSIRQYEQVINNIQDLIKNSHYDVARKMYESSKDEIERGVLKLEELISQPIDKQVTNVTVNGITFSVDTSSLIYPPGVADGTFVINYVVNEDIIRAVVAASFRQDITKLQGICPAGGNGPVSDSRLAIYSNYGVYIYIKICKLLGMRDTVVKNALGNWFDCVDDAKWMQDGYCLEYIYLIYLAYNDLVNWNHWFITKQHPFAIFREVIKLTEINSNPTELLNLISFISLYKPSDGFTECTEKTIFQIRELEKQKWALGDTLIIDLFNPVLESYLKYDSGDTTRKIWNCDSISELPKLEVGTSVACGYDEFLRRFEEFTCGVFKTSPNPARAGEKFNWTNIVIAGGSVRQMIESVYKPRPSSDVDIFICAPDFEEGKKIYTYLRDWFTSPKTLFAVRSSVLYIAIEDVVRTFQVICSDSKSVYSVINRFDTSQIQWAICNMGELYSQEYLKLRSKILDKTENKYYPNLLDNSIKINISATAQNRLSVFGTCWAFETIKTRIATLQNTNRIRTNRLIKTMIAGYHIAYTPEVEKEVGDLNVLLVDKNNNALDEIKRELSTFWYPSSVISAGMSEVEKDNFYLGMFTKMTSAPICSKDVAIIDKNIVIGGNFSASYDAQFFDKLSIMSIRFERIRNRTTTVSDRNGVIKLTSAYCVVSKVMSGEENLTLELTVVDDIAKYTNEPITESILSGDLVNKTKLNVIISKYSINQQVRNGRSIAKTNNGRAINVEEDIVAGDRIQFVFTMKVTVQENVRKIDLDTKTIIKYEEEQSAEVLRLKDELVIANEAEINNKVGIVEVHADINAEKIVSELNEGKMSPVMKAPVVCISSISPVYKELDILD
jgi:hypothetical protein